MITNNLPTANTGNDAVKAQSTAIVKFRPQRKQTGTRAIDKEIRGGADCLKMLQFWAVLGIVGKEYGLHRNLLVFLIGCYYRSEQRTKLGRVPAGLAAYTKDYKGGFTKALIRLTLLDKSPGNEAILSERGNEVIRRYISLVKYANQNYSNALKREARTEYNINRRVIK